MAIGAIICRVCGREICLTPSAHYVSRRPVKTGVTTMVSDEEPVLHDAVDCPHCGCQQILGERGREYTPDTSADDEEEEDDE